MWLKQKIYTLSILRSSDSQEDSTDGIKVKLNGNLTTIEIKQLFAKISDEEFSEDGKTLKLTGWSILQFLDDNEFLLIDESAVSITFEKESFGSLEIESIKNPWFILNDVELSDEEVKSINQKILELSIVSTADDNAGESGSPHASTPVIENKSYEAGKKSFIGRGYKEYSKDNFKLLLLDNGDTFQANLIEILSEDKLIQLQNPVKVTDNFYKFEDGQNETVINVKVIGDEIEISGSDVSIENEFKDEFENH